LKEQYIIVQVVLEEYIFPLYNIMLGKSLVYITVILSLLVQLITGLISFTGIFYKLPDDDKVLSEILTLETGVQLIEFVFYIYLIMSIEYMRTNTVTQRRYIDWLITTPMMLLSTIIYMDYESKKQVNQTIRARGFINNNIQNIMHIFLLNTLMLIAGFLGETGMLRKLTSIGAGFIFLFLNFGIIYKNYVGDIDVNKKLFMCMLTAWSLYGVAALMPSVMKNVSYNMLDIVSKNFYGLFIFYKIREVGEASRRN